MGTLPMLTCSRIYRAKILFALEKSLEEEMTWLNQVSLKYLKNYQIWSVNANLNIKFPYTPTGLTG